MINALHKVYDLVHGLPENYLIAVGGVLVKGQRKWNGLGNQIPEYDEGDVEERLSDVVRISSNFSKNYSNSFKYSEVTLKY